MTKSVLVLLVLLLFIPFISLPHAEETAPGQASLTIRLIVDCSDPIYVLEAEASLDDQITGGMGVANASSSQPFRRGEELSFRFLPEDISDPAPEGKAFRITFTAETTDKQLHELPPIELPFAWGTDATWRITNNDQGDLTLIP